MAFTPDSAAATVNLQPSFLPVDTPPSPVQIFHQIHKLVEISHRFLHTCYIEPLIKHFNLRPSEFDVLMRIYTMTVQQPEGISIKELTARLNINQPATSMIVSNLVNKGYITRRENPSDRRCTLLSIAPQEQALFDTMAEAQGKATEKVLEGMTEKKKKQFFSFIDEMYDICATLGENASATDQNSDFCEKTNHTRQNSLTIG